MAQPNAIPEWTKRIKITGDLRSRDEYDLFSSTNDNQIIDFQSFNANGPTDINALTNNGGIPILNTTQDRLNRLSLRARLGVEAVITDDVFAGLRLASGGDNGPVSTTQLLGRRLGKEGFLARPGVSHAGTRRTGLRSPPAAWPTRSSTPISSTIRI
ncbi:MAG: putative porin [Rhizomicrobium sp.]